MKFFTFTLLIGIITVGAASAQINRATKKAVSRTSDSTESPRCIAYISYLTGANHFPQDSGAFSYTGNRGGDPVNGINFSQEDVYGYLSGSKTYFNDYRDLQTFDDHDNIDTLVYQNWNSKKAAYINYDRFIYSFDSSDNDTLQILQYWDTTKGSWYSVNKRVNIYTHDTLYTVNIYTFDTATHVYTPEYRTVYRYDSHNQIDTEYQGTWKGSAWADTANAVFLRNYNALDEDTLIVELDYNTIDKKLDTSVLFAYTFNAHNPNEDSVYYESYFNRTTHQFDNTDKEIANYDANGNHISTLELQWNDTAWGNYYLYQYDYNTYNEETIVTNFIWISSAWDTTLLLHYYYQDVTTGVKQLTVESGQLTVYPNPASDHIHTAIQLNQTSDMQLRLVNVLGQAVWQQTIGSTGYYNGNIPVSNLLNGVYLLEMVTGGEIETREVVVTK